MTSKLAVIAIGGNSLIKEGRQSIAAQYDAVAETCVHIASMIEAGWEVAIGHGNGPQVGFILRRSELARHELHEIPLDICGADTQGAIGYMLQQNLHNEFRKRGIQKQAATVVTEVVVDRDDPAFKQPSKPIGSFMTEAVSRQRAAQDGWHVVEDAGRGWRRVVASPAPQRVVEQAAVETLLKAGFVVITVGGGGIPVVADAQGNLSGVSAVIDKDFASSLLARSIKAELLLISTAVEKVALNFNQADQRWLDRITVAEARQFMEEGHFAAGSMRPKIQASIWFVEGGGKQAIITNPVNLERALRGETGTWIVP